MGVSLVEVSVQIDVDDDELRLQETVEQAAARMVSQLLAAGKYLWHSQEVPARVVDVFILPTSTTL